MTKSNYIIMADCACDISAELCEKWNVRSVPMEFTFEGDDKAYVNGDMTSSEFYNKMRNGESPSTTAVNVDIYRELFEEEAKQGHDVLHLAFSSGLSATCNFATMAAKEIMEKYPDVKISVVDSLSASAGYGLLLYLLTKKREDGASMDEAVQYALETRMHLCHWFTVDDLVYLKRGGRISASAAFVGGILGIKPVLHMDNEGHLINMLKVRGRKASLKAILDKYDELAQTPREGTVFISHGDCIDDAKELDDMLFEKYGVRAEIITHIGPIIGSHSGPGTIAFFFVGKER